MNEGTLARQPRRPGSGADPGSSRQLTIGVLTGALVGILPGLGGPSAVALLLPFVFDSSPHQAFALLIGLISVTATTGDLGPCWAFPASQRPPPRFSTATRWPNAGRRDSRWASRWEVRWPAPCRRAGDGIRRLGRASAVACDRFPRTLRLRRAWRVLRAPTGLKFAAARARVGNARSDAGNGGPRPPLRHAALHEGRLPLGTAFASFQRRLGCSPCPESWDGWPRVGVERCSRPGTSPVRGGPARGGAPVAGGAALERVGTGIGLLPGVGASVSVDGLRACGPLSNRPDQFGHERSTA